MEKGDQGLDVFLGKLAAQLVAAHDRDCIVQRQGRSIMEIRGGQGDVAQSGNLEDVSILLLAGDIETSLVGRLGGAAIEVVRHDAETLEHVSADANALMATGAAQCQETLIAGMFLGIECVWVAEEETIEPAVRRHQRALEGSDGIGNGLAADAFRVEFFEGIAIGLVLVQLGNGLRPI